MSAWSSLIVMFVSRKCTEFLQKLGGEGFAEKFKAVRESFGGFGGDVMDVGAAYAQREIADKVDEVFISIQERFVKDWGKTKKNETKEEKEKNETEEEAKEEAREKEEEKEEIQQKIFTQMSEIWGFQSPF